MQRFVFIGCSKLKRKKTADRLLLPTELYFGPLFRKRIEYVNRKQVPWFVISAEYGLWPSNERRAYYDKKLSDLAPIDRAAWHVGVAAQMLDYIEPSQFPAVIEIHAGKDYFDPLARILKSVGFRVEVPTAGLGIGKQLQIYTTGALSS